MGKEGKEEDSLGVQKDAPRGHNTKSGGEEKREKVLS